MAALTAAEFEQDFPGDEIVVYRNLVFGHECLILVPKAKLKAIEAAREVARREGRPLTADLQLPLWRHGDVMEVKAAGGGEDAGVAVQG